MIDSNSKIPSAFMNIAEKVEDKLFPMIDYQVDKEFPNLDTSVILIVGHMDRSNSHEFIACAGRDSASGDGPMLTFISNLLQHHDWADKVMETLESQDLLYPEGD